MAKMLVAAMRPVSLLDLLGARLLNDGRSGASVTSAASGFGTKVEDSVTMDPLGVGDGTREREFEGSDVVKEPTTPGGAVGFNEEDFVLLLLELGFRESSVGSESSWSESLVFVGGSVFLVVVEENLTGVEGAVERTVN